MPFKIREEYNKRLDLGQRLNNIKLIRIARVINGVRTVQEWFETIKMI